MCIIAFKPKGNPFPTTEQFKNMFLANDDGAGVGWNDGKKVYWKKGFMTIDDFLTFDTNAPYRQFDCDVVFHFRIGTSGGNRPDTCHPFPISDSDELLVAVEGEGTIPLLFHNGIVSNVQRDTQTSDTQQFIIDILSDKYIYQGIIESDEKILHAIMSIAPSSKFAILYPDTVTILNDKAGTEEGGIWYSNTTFRPRSYTTNYSYGPQWGREYEEGEWTDKCTTSPKQRIQSTGTSAPHKTISELEAEQGTVRLADGKKILAPYYHRSRLEQVFQGKEVETLDEAILVISKFGFVTLNKVGDGEKVSVLYNAPHQFSKFEGSDLDIINDMIAEYGVLIYFSDNNQLDTVVMGQGKLTIKLTGSATDLAEEKVLYTWKKSIN